MITFSALRFGSYLFESLTQTRPGKKFLFSLPLFVSLSTSIFRVLYNLPFLTHTIGSLGSQFVFKSLAQCLPKLVSITSTHFQFVGNYHSIIYLVILIATLTFTHLSLHIAVPLSFFTAVLTGYVYDERSKLTPIYIENKPQPLVCS